MVVSFLCLEDNASQVCCTSSLFPSKPFLSVHLLFCNAALFKRSMIKEKIEFFIQKKSFDLSEVKDCSFYFIVWNMITQKTVYFPGLSFLIFFASLFFTFCHGIVLGFPIFWKICLLQTWNAAYTKKLKMMFFLYKICISNSGTNVMSSYSIVTPEKCDILHGKR